MSKFVGWSMTERKKVLASVVDRMLGWLPGPPDERRPWSPMLPDPNEPGISDPEREQRVHIITTLEEKQGRGSPR